MFSTDACQLGIAHGLGFFLTFLFYGVYICSCVTCATITYRQNGNSLRPVKASCVINSILLFNASLYVGVSLSRFLKAFAIDPGGPAHFFTYPNAVLHWENLATHILTYTMMCIVDGVMVYRCYLVWGSDIRIAAVPILFEIANVALGIPTFLSFKNPHLIPWSTMRKLIQAVGPLHLTQNTITTTLITFRLVHQHRLSVNAGVRGLGTPLMYTARIIIESAMLYTLLLVGYMILDGLDSPYIYILEDSFVPIIGIILNMINIRANLASSTDNFEIPYSFLFPNSSSGGDSPRTDQTHQSRWTDCEC